MKPFLSIHNGQAFSRLDIPHLAVTEFRNAVCQNVASDLRLAVLFCLPEESRHSLYAVLADEENARLHVTACDVEEMYPSLTPACMQAHLFEREIFEKFGIYPEGHPWLKPVRFLKGGHHRHSRIGDMDFFRMEGEEVHEVAVGPVHAGVIEPGHFRFQCHGETVYHLEISMGYQHRGIEDAFPPASPSRRIRLIETASGDSTAGHTCAYCNVLEALADCRVPVRAQAIRGIALELERIACHIGDLGALAGDIGFLPTSAYCGRIRGDVLNLTAELCGNRFSRGLICPGGVTYDLGDAMVSQLLQRLEKIRTETFGAVQLLWDTPSVVARFEGSGKVSKQAARAIGLVGPAARACGIDHDVRRDFAHGIYQYQQIPVSSAQTGDVFARAMVRWLEIQRSFTFVQEMFQSLPASEPCCDLQQLKSNHMAVALVEGWRGEIVHIGAIDAEGRMADYKIVDPSFHNWFGLASALRNEEISDFPLCNKSFNLSYCGFDL